MSSVPPTAKTCSACQSTKPVTAFYRKQGARDGLTARCRACVLLAQQGGIPKQPDHPERFWNKVDAADCWEWTAGRYPNGYGLYVYGGRIHYAHRMSYELLVGQIPWGMELDHLCRNRACVNPDHLEVVTHAENSRRGYSLSGLNARKTQCDKGHPFDETNTYWHQGKRQCKQCRRARNAAWRRRKLATA